MKKLIFCIGVLVFIFFEGSAAAAPRRAALLLDGAEATAEGSGFNSICLKGLQNAQKRFGRKIETVSYNILEDESKRLPTLREAAKRSELLIITSSAYLEYLPQVAAEFPGRTWVAFETGGPEGVTNIDFREDEGGFLAGALAAMTTDKGRPVGIILGERGAVADSFLNGFEAGVWYVSPDVKILSEYTGDYSDGEKAAAAAKRMSEENVSVIFCAAGAASAGAIEGAKSGGYMTIGVDTEMERHYPDEVLASVVKRSGHVIYMVVTEFLERRGTFAGKDFSLGLKDECIGISTWTREAKRNIPVDVRERLDDISEKIEDGLIVIKKLDSNGLRRN